MANTQVSAPGKGDRSPPPGMFDDLIPKKPRANAWDNDPIVNAGQVAPQGGTPWDKDPIVQQSVDGPWKDFAPSSSAGPWTDFAPKNGSQPAPNMFSDLIPRKAPANPFDQFDSPSAANPFDQFDTPPVSQSASGKGNAGAGLSFDDLIPPREKSVSDFFERAIPNDIKGMASGIGNAINYAGGTATGGVTNALNAVLPQSMQITPQNDTERQWLQNANSFTGDAKNAAHSLSSLADGAMASIPGVGQINDFAVQHGLAPAYDKTNENNDKQLFQGAVEPINTPAKLGNMLYEHPVQSAANVAGLLSGAGELADAAQLTRLANALRTGGEFANPVNAVTGTAKLGGKLGSYLFAGSTGATPEALQLAAKTGMEGGTAGKAFRGNMRGDVPLTDVVENVKSAMGNMADTRRNDYLSNMQATSNSNAAVDTAPIWQKLNDLHDSLTVNPGSTGGNASAFGPLQKGTPAEFQTLHNMADLLHQWEAHPQGKAGRRDSGKAVQRDLRVFGNCMAKQRKRI